MTDPFQQPTPNQPVPPANVPQQSAAVPPVNPPPPPMMPGGLPAGVDPAAADQQWYVQTPAGVQGPMQLEGLKALIQAGQVGAGTFVWRQGLSQWAQAGNLIELSGMPFAQTALDPEGRKQMQIIRNAKQNLIVMFVIFVMSLIAIISMLSSLSRAGAQIGQSPIIFFPICVTYGVPIAAIFAAIYMPIRWRVIMSLPTTYKVLGMIGGFGLIALLALSLLGKAIMEIR